MATVQKFEDMICWQKARELTREIYKSLNDETFKRLSYLCEDCSVLIWRLIQSLKVSKFGGLQFKKEKTKQQLRAAKFQKWLDDSEEARKRGEDPPEFEEFDG